MGVTPARPKLARLLISLVLAIGVVVVVVGVSFAVTGRDAQHLPKQIDDIHPVRNATQVQSQEQVVVDLAEGYTGVLNINGVDIETFSLADLETDQGQQASLPKVTIFEPGNSTLTFTPSKGAPIEAFTTGVNFVRVEYWKLTEGRTFSSTFSWQFDVV